MSASASQISTTIALAQWEVGATAAERLCADVLRLEGFDKVDPQSPLGGGDGGKDILCEKDGLSFVAACYFPHEPVTFPRSRKKFLDDLDAASKHGRDAFVFMTNQQLTPGERSELEKEAAARGQRCRIMHREHLRVILDSPQGYAVRYRHLRLGMTPEEQAAYFAASGESTAAALADHTRAIDRLSQRIERFAREQTNLMLETAAVVADAVRADRGGEDVARMLQASAAVLGNSTRDPDGDTLSAALSPAILRYVHRLLMPADLPLAGRYRETQVWLTDPTGQVNADLECAGWDQIPRKMEALCTRWNQQYPQLLSANGQTNIEALAAFFHDLVVIHPFVDGNGRLARAILALQARDLLKLSEDIRMDRGAPYYAALRAADAGDLSALSNLIASAVGDAI